MRATPSRWNKIFGSGPAGLLISLVLLAIAFWLDKRIAPPPLSQNRALLNTLFVSSFLIAVVIIIWSVKSLPPSERGNKLSTRGAFKYVRHPLYAAFLSMFNFGLAVYLNSYVFVLWATLLHPLWHYVIRYEEELMVNLFGNDYVEYQRKTGRFFPRLRSAP